MAFTLVLTVVLGLCVGAVVADVLFGPEQPATSSSGSHGEDRWDPWRRWLLNFRGFLGTLRPRAQRLTRRGRDAAQHSWHALSRSFPEGRPDRKPPPLDVLPPPVAPPFHPRHAPEPSRTNGSTTTPLVEVPPAPPAPPAPPIEPPVEPIGAPTPAPTTPVDPQWPRPGERTDAPEPVPVGAAQPSAAAYQQAPAPAPAHAPAAAFRDDGARPVPAAVRIPTGDRLKAGLALVFFVTAVGAALAMVLLAIGLVAVRALGGI